MDEDTQDSARKLMSNQNLPYYHPDYYERPFDNWFSRLANSQKELEIATYYKTEIDSLDFRKYAEIEYKRLGESARFHSICQPFVSDVEEYFYEAMEEVKKSKMRTRYEEYVEETSSYNKKCREMRNREKMKFPSITAGDDRELELEEKLESMRPEHPDKKPIRLQDLDWGDREDVLRLLFSKMNAAAEARAKAAKAEREREEREGREQRESMRGRGDATFITTEAADDEAYNNDFSMGGRADFA